MFNINNNPKITVIIPTYNGKKYIGETIESIVNQTWQNWELIIIDDGSTDNICEIISAIEDPRIHLYKVARSGIIGRVLNTGLGKATGDLITFIDHDDLWDPTKLIKQIETLQKHPEAGFCLTGGYNFRELNKPIEYFYKQREGIRFDHIFYDCFKSGVATFIQTLMVRRECLMPAFLFRENSTTDTNFIIDLASRFKAVILYEPLVCRRLHDMNHTSLNWEELHYQGQQMIRSYKDSLPTEVFRDTLFKSHISLGEKYLERGKKRRAVQQFLAAWNKKPFNIIPAKKVVKTMLYLLKGK